MKISISFSDLPLKVEIEGDDTVMESMVKLASNTLFELRKIWLNALECQMKLKVSKNDNNPEKTPPSS